MKTIYAYAFESDGSSGYEWRYSRETRDADLAHDRKQMPGQKYRAYQFEVADTADYVTIDDAAEALRFEEDAA